MEVLEAKATGAVGMVIELGYIPIYAEIHNLVSGKKVCYMNTRMGMTQLAIDAALVTNDLTDGEYIGADGILATDSKLRRTAEGSIGQVNANGAGLILDDITDINDTLDEQLLVKTWRAEH